MRNTFLVAGLLATALLTTSVSAETLRYAAATPALTLDPHSTSDFTTTALYRQMYESLINLDPEMAATPGIAHGWEHDGDKTWRFSLRDDVKFHDGSTLTADDVAFSIMRQASSPQYKGLFGGIQSAVAVDATTVDVTSDVGDPILPQRMTRLFIMNKAWSEANGVAEVPQLGATGSEAFSLRNANGTGALKLVSHDPSTRTVLERNADYWGEVTGNVEEFIFMPIGSAPTRLASLLSGEVDMIMDLPLQDIERVKTTTGFKADQIPQLSWMQLEMDGTRDVAIEVYDKAGNPIEANPLKDVRVRQAFAHAIDAQLIVDRVMRGNARVVGIPSVPGLAGHQPQVDQRLETDLDKAKQLLADAGYPDGFQIQLNCPLERYVNTDEICRAAASMLARIGVDVRVKGMLWPDFAAMLVNGPDSSFHLIGAGPNSWDGQDTFSTIISTRDIENNTGNFNWALWSNARVDEINLELAQTFDQDQRDALFEEGFTIARDEVHAVYLHQAMLSWATSDRFDSQMRGDGFPLLADVTVTE
ncbi:ABC transporter substrate-binding protein [Devosia sp. YIM 151766]|uniref:ABC transporter substrate-binding protein n=1 Tax=Devosia sp. YIM 151766 TaxID=3017325 RepID=UPI00255CA43B|nr:ABC transporter substrate-binding protein [Devosia sp. YIM 151766]WIY52707.1 ABC transporter substrate-binding protein [Devosia sp. YIM 151766]